MKTSQRATLVVTATLVSASGCDYTRDYVAPGYYGEMTSACAPAAEGGSFGNRALSPASVAGRAHASSAGVGGRQPPSTTPAAGEASNPSRPDPAPAATTCDMTGKWLVTVHKTTDGLGNLQAVHDYYYYEIEQQAGVFTVTNSLKCGSDVLGDGAFALTIDFKGATAGLIKHTTHNGRTGSSVSIDGGCRVEFDGQYTVVGATIPHYLDPSTTLPTVEQMAGTDTPGWEDWDEDGNPGITGVVEGAVSGKVFAAARDWATFSGDVPETAALLKLAVDWTQEPNVMAFEGSPFLTTEAVRAGNPSLHFVELARLSDDMATGEDLALCQRLVELAPMLTPEAAGL
jgi:hypothetical protein